MGLYLGGVFIWLVLGSGVAYLCRTRERDDAWTLFSVLAWPVALARLLRDPAPGPQIPERTARPDSRALVVARRRCPSCAEMIRADAATCPFCLHRLETPPVESIDWPPWPDPNARILAENIVVPLAFDYASGEERSRRRILATLLFEWADALYLRGHESARGGTRSYSLARMKNVVDERTDERLEGVEAIRDALLRRRPGWNGNGASGPAQARPAPAAPIQPTPVERAAAAMQTTMHQPHHAAAAAAAPADSEAQPELPLDDPATGEPTSMASSDVASDAREDPPGAAAPVIEFPARRQAERSVVPFDDDEAAPMDSDIDIPSPPGPAPLPAHLSLTPAGYWTPALRAESAARPVRSPQTFAFLRGAAVAGAVGFGAIVFILQSRSPELAPAAPATDGAAAALQKSDETLQAARRQIDDTRRELMDLVATLRAAVASVKQAPPPAPAREARPAAAPQPVSSVAPARPVDWTAPLTTEEVRELQSMLVRLGYELGRIDGLMGPRTTAALAAWQRDRQLIVSRHPPRVLLGLMREEVARRAVLRVSPLTTAERRNGRD